MEQKKSKYLAKSANGKVVLMRVGVKYPLDIKTIKEAVKKLELVGEKKKYQVDLGRVVGYDIVVETEKGVKGSLNGTKQKVIICDEEPVETNYVTLTIIKSGKVYIIANARAGAITPPMPWSDSAKQNAHVRNKSEKFWSTHAFSTKSVNNNR